MACYDVCLKSLFVELFQQQNHISAVNNDLEHLDLDSIATSTVAVPHDLVPSNAMDVYRNYNFEHNYENNLPIADHRDEVGSRNTFRSLGHLNFAVFFSFYAPVSKDQGHIVFGLSVCLSVCQSTKTLTLAISFDW
jgi:hypothetical protein